MSTQDEIIARTRVALESFHAPGGTLTAHRMNPKHSRLDRFILGLDYPDRYGMTLDCPHDFEQIIVAYFQANPEVKAIVVSIKGDKADFKTMDLATLVQHEGDAADELKLARMRDLNKIMYTGRPGEEDYNPDSTTPCVSDEELKGFEDAIKIKRAARKPGQNSA